MMSLTKLSLARNNLIIPGQGELVSDVLAGDRKISNQFTDVFCTSKSKKIFCYILPVTLPGSTLGELDESEGRHK